MAKGYLAGAIWGLVASALGAGALSLAVGLPEPGTGSSGPDAALTSLPDDPATDTSVGPVPGSGLPDPAPEAQLPDTPPLRFEENTDAAPEAAPPPPEPARRPAAETDVAEPSVETLEVPEADSQTALNDTATAPAAIPEPALESGAPPMPEAALSGGGVAVTTDAPVLPSVQAALPDAPGAEREPLVATEPAQPPQPVVPAETSGLVAETDPSTRQRADESADESTDESTGQETPAPEVEPTPPAQAQETPPAQSQEIDAPEALPESTVRIIPAPQAATDGSGRPAVGTPAISLADRANDASEGRLPTVGTEAEAETDATDAQTTSPLILFGAPVDLAEGLPRLAIVLIDDGSGPLGPEAFEDFPFPVTFALDATRPGTPLRMQGYRARGFEVLALAGVPEGAQPSDVEVALQASLAAVPEAVGVLENPDQGLQGSRAVSDQVAAALKATGHGLVLQDNGLNTAASLAAREGVPAATVFKDFDGRGQDPSAMRRFLDGAAFRARQDGAAVVMGRLSADTLSAVLLWGLQDRSGQLALVPVSRVLREAAGL